jgi:hypothetical protein
MSPTPLIIHNTTRGRDLATAGRVAAGMWSRMRGLIGTAPLQVGEGLVIARCNSVHTHFMGYAIDVAYLDAGDVVVAMDHAMKPWRFGRIHWRAKYVIELPAGTLAATGTAVGDRLEVRG